MDKPTLLVLNLGIIRTVILSGMCVVWLWMENDF